MVGKVFAKTFYGYAITSVNIEVAIIKDYIRFNVEGHVFRGRPSLEVKGDRTLEDVKKFSLDVSASQGMVVGRYPI